MADFGPHNPIKTYTATLTPAAVATVTCAAEAFTVTGVTTADRVVCVTKAAAQAGLAIGDAWVSDADEVTINFINPTAAAITPTAAEVYTFTVLKG